MECAGQESAIGYRIPPSLVAHIIISDPSCPIKITDASYIGFSGGSSQNVYTIHNPFSQTVKSFEIIELNWFGSPFFTKRTTSLDNVTLLPNESVSTLKDNIVILDLTEKSPLNLETLGMGNGSRTIWILMVTRVELSNGRVYDRSNAFRSLQEFIDGLNFSEKPSDREFVQKEAALREFVAELEKGAERGRK